MFPVFLFQHSEHSEEKINQSQKLKDMQPKKNKKIGRKVADLRK